LIAHGPTLLVDIGFDPTFVSGQAHPPVSGVQNFAALVDSGAQECCIDSLLATQLGLPMVDRVTIAGAHGAKEVNVYLAQITSHPLNFVMHGRFAAVDLIGGGQAHYALLGRTFLRHMTMVYEGGTGTVTLTSI
jgi:hypothetical protein